MANALRAGNAADTSEEADATGAALTAYPIFGLACFARLAFAGADTAPLVEDLEARIARDSEDAGALMDLSILKQLRGERDEGLRLQGRALALCRLYRVVKAHEAVSDRPVRLLALFSPGDFLANTPIDFVVQSANVTLDLLFMAPGEGLPAALPDHDVLLLGVGFNEENAALLESLKAPLSAWPRPVINQPHAILNTSREGVAAALAGAPGLYVPPVARLERHEAERLARGEAGLDAFLPGEAFPIIIRPLGSHAGHGLEKIEAAAALAAYLAAHADEAFHIAPFVDYRGEDGFFRKARIVFFGGKTYLAHLAVSERWMIHYLNAGMLESAEKRAIEAAAMMGFDSDFAVRHAEALTAVAERLKLDYGLIDCGETRDGRLLVFEADNAMVIHDMDDAAIYPYKGPQMARVFAAFEAYLRGV